MSRQRSTFLRDAKTSYAESVARFDVCEVAAKYPSQFGKSWRERREVACLRSFFKSLPVGSRILDLPCGTGRLTPLMAERGFEIVGADSSPNMVGMAEANWLHREPQFAGATARFEVHEGAQTDFADRSFDAIVCNRLFHHFRESHIRVAVLQEFRRICRGPIYFSFFNSFSIDTLRFRLKHWLRGTIPTDRIRIPMREMLDDVAAAGLQVRRVKAILPGISPMCYLETVSLNSTEHETSKPMAAGEIETILDRIEMAPVPIDESVGETTATSVFESTAA